MRKTFPWLRELLTRFHASWIAGAKSQEGENPNGGEDRPVCFAYAMPMPGHRRLYVWPPVVPTSSCQCSALAREIKRARRIRARSRKCLAAAANPFLGRGHLDTRLANHTLDGLKRK
jgi:hypothetical protein